MVYILELVDGSQAPQHYFRNPKYLSAEILLDRLAKVHHLLADAHLLPYAKRRFRTADAKSAGLHPLPYRKNVRIGHSRVRHASRRVNRVIVGPDKLSEKIDTYAGIFICKIIVKSIANSAMSTFHDRTFEVGFITQMKLCAITP